jgi:hypothetical protein
MHFVGPHERTRSYCHFTIYGRANQDTNIVVSYHITTVIKEGMALLKLDDAIADNIVTAANDSVIGLGHK